MKILIKIVITILIILTIPISIYYGLRLRNTPFLLEHINRSYVVTLPNKVWFEIDGSKDTLDEKQIFENETINLNTTGYNFGLQYPTYTTTTENNTAKRTVQVTRVGDTITVEQEIKLYEIENGEYIRKIYFSQFGEFRNNTYIKDGCEVQITANGHITYDKDYSIVNIAYQIDESEVSDTILLNISCK
jgi:hypothetical protein